MPNTLTPPRYLKAPLPAQHAKMPKWFGAYFVSYDEIVQIFQDAGGTLSDAAIRQKMHAERQARRAIFNYIMPGTIRVNVNLLDEVGGFTFIIGPDDVEYEDIDKELLDRCEDMFLGEPDRFMSTDDPYEFTLERDGKTHVLEYVDYVEYVPFCLNLFVAH